MMTVMHSLSQVLTTACPTNQRLVKKFDLKKPNKKQYNLATSAK